MLGAENSDYYRLFANDFTVLSAGDSAGTAAEKCRFTLAQDNGYDIGDFAAYHSIQDMV